ncbi:MAG: hypothetical protein RL358_1766 [Pseudomonadota bacterium]|jgi:hypothetical protein
MRNHLFHICIGTFIALVALAGFNYLIDPYNIWNSPKIRGLNTAQSELGTHERIYKTVGLARHPADTVILGTSRSDIGLNPDHPALESKAINLAISAQPNRETRKLFDALSDKQEINTFVIGLDFFVSNNLLSEPPDFVVENFSHSREWKLALSGSTLKDSALTILKRKALLSDTWSEHGLRLWSAQYIKDGGGHRKLMKASENGYLSQLYLPVPSCSYDISSTNGRLPQLEEIRAIFARAHRDHITLKLLISASHARQWETLAAGGLWGKWEEWKHRLVKMNEEEAQRAGQPVFPLWDFSGYHSISTETVPALGDTTTMMRWYFDSSHYTPAAGDLVLDRIFDYKSPSRTVPDDFGVLLTSKNIEAHLVSIRAAREHYRLSHPEDIAEIEAMAQEVTKAKHCR